MNRRRMPQRVIPLLLPRKYIIPPSESGMFGKIKNRPKKIKRWLNACWKALCRKSANIMPAIHDYRARENPKKLQKSHVKIKQRESNPSFQTLFMEYDPTLWGATNQVRAMEPPLRTLRKHDTYTEGHPRLLGNLRLNLPWREIPQFRVLGLWRDNWSPSRRHCLDRNTNLNQGRRFDLTFIWRPWTSRIKRFFHLQDLN